MSHITNENGDVQVITNKGEVRWLPPNLVKDSALMKKMALTIPEGAEKYESVDQFQQEINVAEVAPAKRGRKPNK